MITSTEICKRIDVRDRVKRLQKEPREESRLEVERLRQALTIDLIRLQSLQSNLNHTESTEPEEPYTESFDMSDEVEDTEPSGPNQLLEESDPDRLALLPEHRPLHLPSSHYTTNHPLRLAELDLRIKQATQYLVALRNAIAEKSFQYSHVLRSAPTKGARTRSRSVILKISERISQYSRVYCRARAAMV